MEKQDIKKDECLKYFMEVLKTKPFASIILIKELECLWKEVDWRDKKTL